MQPAVPKIVSQISVRTGSAIEAKQIEAVSSSFAPQKRTNPVNHNVEMLNAIFKTAANQFIELRPIRRNEGALKPEFFPIQDAAKIITRAKELSGKADVYFGVAPRNTHRSGGEAVATVTAVWADIDSPQALEALQGFELGPSIVVRSGTSANCHAYWLTKDPVDPGAAETLNRAIAGFLGSDPAVHDRARILRVPGTLNHKTSPPTEVTLESLNDRRYSTDELWAALPSGGVSNGPGESAVADSNGQCSDQVQAVLGRLNGLRPCGEGWSGLCPAHDDHNPSLSVSEGKGGRCLLKCHAGCDIKDIVQAIGMSMADLAPHRSGGGRTASRLARRVLGDDLKPFHTSDQIGYIDVTVGGHRETWRINSSQTRSHIRRVHFETEGEAASDEVVSDVVATLEAIAQFDGAEHDVHLRVAESDRGIVIDRGDVDWTAIEVTGDGWEVVDCASTRFSRDGTMLPLPIPIHGGSIDELRPFVNVADEPSWKRFVGFLVGAFSPKGSFPICFPHGEQGSAKSTLSRVASSLIDPRKAPLQMGTPSVRDLAVTANSVWMCGFDNVSSIPRPLSDALCQLSTGGGYRTRQLYTDADPFVLELKRPVILNAIGQVITRPDLVDRTVGVKLLPISPTRRRPERRFWAEWEEVRPRVLGALLDGVASAIANQDGVVLLETPRLADFATWGEAAGAAFDWEPEAFTTALQGGQEEQLELSVDAHPEIGQVVAFMSDTPIWEGSATQLLEILTGLASDSVAKSHSWPKRPDLLSNRLTEHASYLRTHEITVERIRLAGGNRDRVLRLTKGDAGTQGDANA